MEYFSVYAFFGSRGRSSSQQFNPVSVGSGGVFGYSRGIGLVFSELTWDSVELAVTTDDDTLLRLNDALKKLELESSGKVELIKLRFFAGLSLAETAQTLGISLATAKRHWAFARRWLLCELKE